jgi:hypothetical protein
MPPRIERIERDCPCPWKHRFATEYFALAEAKMVRKKAKHKMWVYCCPCGYWHTTSKAPRTT